MCRNSKKWVFTLPAEFRWSSGDAVPEDLVFRDKEGTPRLLVFRSGEVAIPPDYAWDGCTPKGCLFDLVFGTPDGVIDARTLKPKTYYASLVHDAMYQFLLDGLPYKRVQVDRYFLRLMRETGFRLRGAYWLAVRLFGWLAVAQHRYVRKNRGHPEPLAA